MDHQAAIAQHGIQHSARRFSKLFVPRAEHGNAGVLQVQAALHRRDPAAHQQLHRRYCRGMRFRVFPDQWEKSAKKPLLLW